MTDLVPVSTAVPVSAVYPLSAEDPLSTRVPLSATALVTEQATTLSAPRRRHGLLARILFITMDVAYGKQGPLSKFKVLELVARVPYQAWEQVAYVALTHKHQMPDFARRVFEFVREARAQQDNEQWHLLIMQELVHQRGIREGFFRFRILPQLLAFTYYHISWMLYVLRPSLSYGLNADFEDHAEHEYMNYVATHPELAEQKWETAFAEDYGPHETLADVFRQLGVDERHHKEQSIAHMAKPRFQ